MAEVEAITAALRSRRDPAYEAGMRRTVPSALPAHVVRVPELRKVVIEWTRRHRGAATYDVIAVCEELWATGWREEMLVAIALLARSKGIATALPWEVIERWSGQIENWEHVDHLADVAGAMLRTRPELSDAVEALAASEHSWQRRLAIVTLIAAARKDAAWASHLEAMASRLQGDRGPTLRKAVVWARRVLGELETQRA
jgi:3-methyladenine DNA glycosylase AlkD